MRQGIAQDEFMTVAGRNVPAEVLTHLRSWMRRGSYSQDALSAEAGRHLKNHGIRGVPPEEVASRLIRIHSKANEIHEVESPAATRTVWTWGPPQSNRSNTLPSSRGHFFRPERPRHSAAGDNRARREIVTIQISRRETKPLRPVLESE
jgi:hypothetical protein